MTRILYDLNTTELVPYPREDDADVVGLDPRYLELLVVQEPQPSYDPATQQLEATTNVDLDTRVVRYGWVAVPLPPPPPPAPDWLGFAGWLYQFPPIAAAMEAARASTDPQGEPATTGLPAAMDEARLRQNYPAFSQTWGQFLLASAMAPEVLAAIVVRAVECNLPAEFVAALTPIPS